MSEMRGLREAVIITGAAALFGAQAALAGQWMNVALYLVAFVPALGYVCLGLCRMRAEARERPGESRQTF